MPLWAGSGCIAKFPWYHCQSADSHLQEALVAKEQPGAHFNSADGSFAAMSLAVPHLMAHWMPGVVQVGVVWGKWPCEPQEGGKGRNPKQSLPFKKLRCLSSDHLLCASSVDSVHA